MGGQGVTEEPSSPTLLGPRRHVWLAGLAIVPLAFAVIVAQRIDHLV